MPQPGNVRATNAQSAGRRNAAIGGGAAPGWGGDYEEEAHKYDTDDTQRRAQNKNHQSQGHIPYNAILSETARHHRALDAPHQQLAHQDAANNSDNHPDKTKNIREHLNVNRY